MMLLDQNAFGTTVLGLLVLLAAIVVGVLSVLPMVLSLAGHWSSRAITNQLADSPCRLEPILSKPNTSAAS
jgi:hypothetical protein